MAALRRAGMETGCLQYWPLESYISSPLEKTKICQPACRILPFSWIVLKPGKDSYSAVCLTPFHSLREVLQLKLQQRRTREELVSQGIMPPLKSPAAFHEQRRSLERARTEDYLKRKIRSRPERSELVRMHILEETSAEPSLQAKQLKLKRARLADDLNEKIAQRPGPMELVEKNILPVESSLKEAIIVGQVNYPKVADSSSFDEDSSDALSPEQPASHESQGSVPSPLESRVSDPLPSATSISPTQVLSQLPMAPDPGETLFLAEQPPLPPTPLLPPSLTNGSIVPTAKPAPTLIKQSQPKSASEKSQRSKKAKELKPKVKKLKYHQYIPPDQKQDKGAPAMDSSYAKILQQQQLFLQLQILNQQQQQQQQQQHYNYQAILPAPPKPAGETPGSSTPTPSRSLSTSSSSSSGTPGSGGLARQNSTALASKPGALPANLDDMKVAELKQELKLRSLPVSGTKTELIERLRAYQDQVSPAPGAPKAPATTSVLSKAGEIVKEEGARAASCCLSPGARAELEGLDKDQMLQEKDKQIEELTRMLQQKQQLVELLRLQLEQQKRAQQPAPASSPVKRESGFSSCQLSCQPQGSARAFGPGLVVPTTNHGDAQAPAPESPPVVVKQEAVPPEPDLAPGSQLLLGSQGSGFLKRVSPPTLVTDSTGTHLILTVTNKSADGPGLPTGSPQQPLSQPGSPAPGPPAQMDLEHPPQPSFATPTSLLKKEPPSYEETVTQQPKQQENGSSSQHMDDLFDILIQSGEISADFKEPPSLPGKEKSPPAAAYGPPLTPQPSPLSELPQAAPPPGSPTLPGRLEDFLESSTGLPLLTSGHEGPEPLSLIDDLHSQMLSSSAILDHPPSPMDTSELHFAPEPSSGMGLDLAVGHLDSMDWLELSSGGPVLSLAPLSTAAPSLFSMDFLDGHDLQLHWDSCL
ncbi:myocardin-related transcription factor A isoform X5 [Arvicanthis niloticus]|uniref:myocardin-related transcription factor A isoform X5 n=1 Tax=Arvicanthis niloticus TaxID=61156 RepID=UPI00402B28A0